jgi:hypothetical protein
MTLTGTTWHRVDVRDSPVLARTRVSLIGVLDSRAIETIDEAVLQAEDTGHTLTFELSEISSITPDALATLLDRAQPPYDGPLGFLQGAPSSEATS